MVVVMLAAEDPSVDGPLASTPRRGMDCVDKANTAAKKLVQARLPFKRLNPEPKESRETKKTRTGPSAPPTHESSTLDRENEDVPSLSLQRRPALVNGRGPLDSFMSRRKCPLASSTSVVTIDLTEDSNSTDAVKQQPSAPVDALCPITVDAAQNTQNALQTKEPETALADSRSSEENMETNEAEDSVVLPEMDLTLESEAENEHEKKQQEEAEVSKNESLLSPVSTSSVSLVESSPEPSKSTPTTPASVPRTDTEQKKVKRRSLKSSQELEERQRQREEKERQKQEAKAAKEKKREEARKLKEEKEREKKEKKEKEEKERREKKERDDKEKAERLRAKEEQRKVKIEAKLEEKRKKEEEKRLKEEKERIKAEKAEITRFLQKPKTQLAPKTLASVCGKFAPFEIKEHMTLAPLTRVHCDEAVLEELDRYLAEPDTTLNGLKDWTAHKPRKSGPTKPRHIDTMSDCLVVTDSSKPDDVPDRKRCGRMKLLQFHENYRPAYWGTWSKKSNYVSPRCPFKQDRELLDYEVDSDEEWEEEEPGESLSHSEGDDDDDGGDDDDDDDGFFVPHGYLSDGEGALEDEEGGDLEKQKVRQTLKAREWDELMAKRKLKVLEAVVMGCMWEGEKPSPELLQPYAVCMLEPLPREEPSTPEDDASCQQRKEQLLSQLLPLLHGNVNSSKVIITEFQEFCRQQTSSPTGSPQNSDNIPPRIHVKRLIKGNAVYEKRSTYRRCCWYVHADVLARFGQEALPVPCKWTYLTSGAQMARDEPSGQQPGSQNTSPTAPQSTSTTPSNKRKSASNHSITKYMKKCTDPEQTEVMETDGFQADTEDDDDDDCIVLSEQSGSSEQDGQTPTTGAKSTEPVDTKISDAALSLRCPTPATA
ncbi:chromatin assembly factor 1 subunit A [Colossoma macropomum]|uniref:chromatin assembly factor 1 subunit A n=1 Tax=Colossoma macropomum TaxID=42526 RepID=UPI001864EB62|nr:chromatin assembly factor 1 subunit A [Colossoma macropomum]